MARVYATPAQYTELAEETYPGSDKELAARLRAASTEVASLTRFAIYATDDAGFPSEDETLAAFAEATCAIVEHWADTDDPRGVVAAQGAVKIGSVSIGTTSSGSSDKTPYEILTARIGDRAVQILADAGLITSRVAHT